MEKIFVVSSPGLEPITTLELNRLGLLPTGTPLACPIENTGGVEFIGSDEELYKANLHLRTVNRVLLRLGEFHAAAFSELSRHTQHLPLNRFITPGQKVALRVTCHTSRLYHSSAVAREVIKAINLTLDNPIVPCKASDDPGDEPPQLILIRLVNDQCTISIDTSGQLLHRRG